MSRPSFRVHLVTHHDGHVTGRLLPASGRERDAPAGYGATQEQVLSQLELVVQERAGELRGYRWGDPVELHHVRVKVHPQSVVKKRHVIGKEEIVLQITYVSSRQDEGGHRVLVPRFGWWFVLEDVAMAPGVIKQAVSTALLGEGGGSLFSFRPEVREEVIEWSPRVPKGASRARRGSGEDAMPTLHAVAEELVAAARSKRGRPVVGRIDLEPWLPLVLQPTPRSLLLVGPTGSGKTTWVRALARRLSRLDRSQHAYIPRVWTTSAERIVAGMMYLGQWEQRCLDLVEELSGEGDLLHAGPLAALVRPRTSRTSIADMLLPAVRDGELSLVCECDEATLETLGAQHPVLLGQFVTVPIDEPSAAAMPHLLDDYQRRVMRGLRIEPAGLRRLVQHLDLFQRDTGFPGKGVRFIDWLAAEQDVVGPADGGTREDAAEPTEIRELSADEVSAAFSRSTGLPLEIISDAHRTSLATIQARLEEGVVGQSEACRLASRVITRLKAGLDDPERPVGSLLFVGPTGVGKTELAKQLARYLFGDAKRMIRLDMSEYMMPGSASRMLAVGRGVTSLVERVRRSPLSLVLLDEIEKAHPEVFDLMLGMLGEGRMTDVEGALVDFSMTIIVMTSNLGVSRTAAPGFGGTRNEGAALVGEVRKHFRPELFNRIDHVVPFRALSPQDILKVVDLELRAASRRGGFDRRGLRLRADAEARERLATLGFSPTRGARPLRRTIEELVIGPLAELLAADRTLRDAELHVVAEGSERHRSLVARGRIVVPIPAASTKG